MKSKLLILIMTLLGIITAKAQTDTIRDERDQIPKNLPVTSPSDEKTNDDFVLIPNDKLPAALRQALLNEKYAGWENAGVYQNITSKEFTIEVRSAAGTRKYHFDEKGQPITGLAPADNGTPN